MKQIEYECLRKNRYNTEQEAKDKAKKSTEITGDDWSAYECRWSNGETHFHIGHTPRSKRAAKEAKKRWRQRDRERRQLAREERNEAIG